MNKLLTVLGIIFACLGLTFYIVDIIIYYVCNPEPIWNVICISGGTACAILTLALYFIDDFIEIRKNENIV